LKSRRPDQDWEMPLPDSSQTMGFPRGIVLKGDWRGLWIVSDTEKVVLHAAARDWRRTALAMGINPAKQIAGWPASWQTGTRGWNRSDSDDGNADRHSADREGCHLCGEVLYLGRSDGIVCVRGARSQKIVSIRKSRIF